MLRARRAAMAKDDSSPSTQAAARDTPSPGPTREEVGDDFWDPPCKVCKKVDDEANVLCELCNDAYHLACLENMKPALPRSPDDDEWFCRQCVRRGVPEEILDRVGRESSARFLVKWLGRASTEVSWEDATTLDTAWSRKLICDYVTRIEPAKRASAQLLPPCHPLVDTLSATASAAGAASGPSSKGGGVPAETKALAPDTEAVGAGARLLETLTVLCNARVPASHPLSPLARETVRVLRTTQHPRCAGLAPWLPIVDPASQQACAAVEKAATALADAAALLDPDGFSKPAAAGAANRAPRRKAGKHRGFGEEEEDTPVLRAAPPPTLGEALAAGAALDGAKTASLLGTLHAFAKRASPPAHVLAPAALGAARLLVWLEHPEWAKPQGSWEMAVEVGTKALRALRASFDSMLGAPPPAASNEATAAMAAAAATANTYRSYLCYLKEHRERLRCAAPSLTAGELDVRAAVEFTQLDKAARAALDVRALQTFRENVHSVPPALAGTARRGAGAKDAGAQSSAPSGGGGAARGESKRRRPCIVCRELDRRDCLTCVSCGNRKHLMCCWPPVATAPEGEDWTCDECRCAVPALRVPKPGDELEAEVQENEANGGSITWKRAVVLKSAPHERFVLMINPDEEDDFIEEYGMADEGKEWRRPASALQTLAAARKAAEEAVLEVATEKQERAAALARDVAPRVPPTTPADKKLLSLVEELYRDGVTVLVDGITPEQVELAEDVVERGYKHYMHAVKVLDLQEKLQDVGFYEIKMRSGGRYDLQLPELSSPPFSFLTADAPWMPLVHAALGSDAVLTHFGCMLSFPGSAIQPWHSDGPHMRGCGEMGHGAEASSFHAPVHALNVFVPLVDLTMDKVRPPTPRRVAQCAHTHSCSHAVFSDRQTRPTCVLPCLCARSPRGRRSLCLAPIAILTCPCRPRSSPLTPAPPSSSTTAPSIAA